MQVVRMTMLFTNQIFPVTCSTMIMFISVTQGIKFLCTVFCHRANLSNENASRIYKTVKKKKAQVSVLSCFISGVCLYP